MVQEPLEENLKIWYQFSFKYLGKKFPRYLTLGKKIPIVCLCFFYLDLLQNYAVVTSRSKTKHKHTTGIFFTLVIFMNTLICNVICLGEPRSRSIVSTRNCGLSRSNCLYVFVVSFFLIWSPLVKRHLFDHLLWSICNGMNWTTATYFGHHYT